MIALIGGSGFYEFEGVENPVEHTVVTPFGYPSDSIIKAEINGVSFLFLPRHARGHLKTPSEINYKANIWALKSLGSTEIVSVSAVGSLKQNIKPGDIVLPDQYFDWTRGKRDGTFFGNGITAHISTAKPVCNSLKEKIIQSAEGINLTVHEGGAYACVEGPRLGTRAESLFLKGAGCNIVGMTNVPEAFLAREARLCYASVCIVTDYDCWMEDPSMHADVQKILNLYAQNLSRLKLLTSHLISNGNENEQRCGCSVSVKDSLVTKFSLLSEQQKELVHFLDA